MACLRQGKEQPRSDCLLVKPCRAGLVIGWVTNTKYPLLWRRTGGREARRIGGGRGTGGGRRGGRKRDSQEGGRPGEIEKNFATLHNILQ